MTRPQTSDAPPAGRSGYNRQLILAFAGSGDDAATTAQAEALDRKRREPPLPSEVVAVRRGPAPEHRADGGAIDELRRALAGQRQVPLPVNGRSRLYLVGVGNVAERTLADWPPAAMAALLASAGLRELALLSIVSDGAGRDPDRDDAGQADPEATSFASLLHQALRADHGIVTTVNARVGAVRVLSSATPSGAAVIAAGRKLTAPHPDSEPTEHHAPHNKLHLRWDGGRQVREWRY